MFYIFILNEYILLLSQYYHNLILMFGSHLNNIFSKILLVKDFLFVREYFEKRVICLQNQLILYFLLYYYLLFLFFH